MREREHNTAYMSKYRAAKKKLKPVTFAEKYSQMVKTFGGEVRPLSRKFGKRQAEARLGVLAFAPSYGTKNGQPLWRTA